MQAQSADMKACIEACLDCHKTCLGMAMNHCLEAGGDRRGEMKSAAFLYQQPQGSRARPRTPPPARTRVESP